jgi:predicted nucleotide-binding protein
MVDSLSDELRSIADDMQSLSTRASSPDFVSVLAALEKSANSVALAWSGSSFGFHSRIYYADLQPPPPGAHFSAEWGLNGVFQGTVGDWREYPYATVVDHIRHEAGDPDMDQLIADSEDAKQRADEARSQVASILAIYLASTDDEYIKKVNEQVESIVSLSRAQCLRAQLPSGSMWSRDTLAISQGLQTAPHQEIYADVVSIRSPFLACSELATLASRAASHLERGLGTRSGAQRPIGTSVFIGHGRSRQWRELKDFVQDRLLLSWDEFNRVPVAGVTNISRLGEMLDSAGIAFLVLTAEDELSDGTMVARQNVVHEAGLFQGRLGFTRAIVVLEEGCEAFSNIDGLGQIRFPRENISACFEDIRQVLEREGFVGD